MDGTWEKSRLNRSNGAVIPPALSEKIAKNETIRDPNELFFLLDVAINRENPREPVPDLLNFEFEVPVTGRHFASISRDGEVVNYGLGS